jgi:leucyl aminopeptidase
MIDKQTLNHDLLQVDRGQPATAIRLVDQASFPAWLATLAPAQRSAIEAQKFTGAAYQQAIVPEGEGWFAAGGVANGASLSTWCLAALAERLPAGTYRVAGESGSVVLGKALHGWVTAHYRFDRYRPQAEAPGPRILLTSEAKAIGPALAEAAAVGKVRDLVNTPAQDMGPAELEDEVRRLGDRHKARVNVVVGDALLRDYPLVHAVGRAAERGRAPRMVELVWGAEDAPRLALVGKGVCFDSGGLDIKPSSGMALMKKDMGGAAHAVALAGLVMDFALPVRLHLLIPAVENAISASAFRPGDIFASREGRTIEITNTDAEGRLILADALTRACEERPQLILDFATLTGAARAALGPELPALMARQDATATGLLAAGEAHDDPVWRLPLHDGYREWLKSDVADMVNAHANGFAGAIVAGLFLDRFVGEGIDWAHFDTFAWRPTAKPGRPKGGEALGLRAAWHYLRQRFAP